MTGICGQAGTKSKAEVSRNLGWMTGICGQAGTLLLFSQT